MPRFFRTYLLACIAIAFAYLLLHAREPLRLNVGDPWSDANVMSSVEYVKQYGFTTHTVDGDPLISDSYRPTHYPPLAEIIYGGAGKLGVSDIGTFRLLALAFSALGAWLLFQYARRIWGDTVALLATALFTTSVVWMMYADNIHRPPIMHAACFLALWGLVRAIETKQRRHYAAAIVGSFACLFTAYDDWLFLPAGVLFTIYIKLGDPRARGSRRLVMTCATGCLAAILMKSLFATGPLGWQASIDLKLGSPLSTLLRRYTLLFTPMFWITLGYTTWRALRAPSLRSALEDGVTWMLAVAAIFLYVSPQHIVSPTLRTQALLPFYAIGSAILIARLLEGGRVRRSIAIAWGAVAPVWAFYVMLSHPRSVLDREEVAKVNAYLATSDRNDFVMSNLLSDGPLEASFGRHGWPVPDADGGMNPHAAQLAMLGVFEAAGTDYVHAVIFTTPDSRFVDRSLGQLVMRRRLSSVTGWPYLNRSKANEVIRDYDKKVRRNLDAAGAKQVLHLSNFDVYRIDRPTVLELAGRPVPVTREIDFSSLGSNTYKLLGWGYPWLTEEQLAVTSVDGHLACPNPVVEHRAGAPSTNACETMPAESGLRVLDKRLANRAQVMIRVDRVCDLRLTLELASTSLLGMSINDFTTSQCVPAKRVSFLVPQRSVRPGVNIITFEKRRFGPKDPRADVRSLAIDPICEAAR